MNLAAFFTFFAFFSSLTYASKESDSIAYYPVSSGTKYSWNKGYPQSCTCAENTASSSQCNIFKCKCICDVTAGKCDYNCCCDPDCSVAQVSRFKNLDSCLKEGGTPDTETLCYSSLELQQVNPKPPMGGESAIERAVGEVLCVEKKNTYFQGEFYEDVDLYTSNAFSLPVGTKSYSYPDSIVPNTPDPVYDAGDNIPTFRNYATSTPEIAGSFSLPDSDFSGYCNDKAFGRFGDTQPDVGKVEERSIWQFGLDVSQECVRKFSAVTSLFNAECSYQQSIDRYISTLYIAKRSDSVSVSSSQAVPVNMTTVLYQDSLTGVITDITSQFTNCGTAAITDPVNYGPSIGNYHLINLHHHLLIRNYC